MWCRHCKQETPALGPAGEAGPRCARCQRTSPPATLSGPQPQLAASGPTYDDDARRQVYRTLRSAHATISAGEASRTFRFDVAQSPLAEELSSRRHQAVARPRTSATESARPLQGQTPAPSTRGQLGAWMLASFGAACLGLGLGLGAWSLVGDRPDLWNPALAATLGGQGLLIVGLVQLLASIWNAARLAAGKLSLMHDELRRLRRTTEEQAGRNAASAGAFYADLARGSSNDMLLGNLRGQLDELAARVR